MDFKKLPWLLQQTNGLLKKYKAQDKTYPHDRYRIVDILKSGSHAPQICFQVIGKSAVTQIQPKELIEDYRLLEGFSKHDIRTIIYLAYEQIKKPLFYIVAQEFNLNINRMLFKLKKRYSSESFSKTADQITLDKGLINQLSPEDIQCISYVAGYEHALQNDLPPTRSLSD